MAPKRHGILKVDIADVGMVNLTPFSKGISQGATSPPEVAVYWLALWMVRLLSASA